MPSGTSQSGPAARRLASTQQHGQATLAPVHDGKALPAGTNDGAVSRSLNWAPTPTARRRALIGALVSVAGTGIAWGTLTPLVPVLLERQGVPGSLIGLNAAMPIAATFCIALNLGWLMRRLGALPLLLAGIAVIVPALLAMHWFRSYEASLVLRFVIGLGGAAHWILSETWINSAAPPERRGLMVGIYASTFMSGFVIGPLLLASMDLDKVWPFVCIAALVAASGIALLLVRRDLPPIAGTGTQAQWPLLLLAPIIFVAVAAAGLIDSAIWALLPVYAIEKGARESYALLLASILNAGTVGSQIMLGWMADRTAARRVLIGCAIVCLAASATLPFVLDRPVLLWPALFLLGSAAAGLYSITLAELGQRFQGASLAAANGLFVMFYSFGLLLGAPAAGLGMDHLGPDALPAWTLLIAAAFLLTLLLGRRMT